MRHKPYMRAFSLVELSIVLVILGLLVGGVLSGRSLIRASELRSVTTQYSEYVAAVNSFKGKYFALPGDMTNATQFWGGRGGSNPSIGTCISFGDITNGLTCNGDGAGTLKNPDVASIGGYAYEQHLFWAHLSNAGLVQSTGTGQVGVGPDALENYYSPMGKLGTSRWVADTWVSIVTRPGDDSDPDYLNLGGRFQIGSPSPNGYGNILALGSEAQISVGYPIGPILTPQEQWNIDTKMDDGKPGQGKLVVYARGGLNTCTTTNLNTATTADYLNTSTTNACAPIFINAF